VTSMNKTIIQT